jgi:capsular exopolysaccharide synthesis family protein
MDIDGTRGLTDMLMGKGEDLETFKTDILDTWYVMPSGDIPPNPSELLGSHRMEAVLEELKKYFDYIVLDLPPVNIVSDALSISHLISGMIVVIREDYTEKKELEHCMRSLKLSNVNVLGCVINGAKLGGGSYGKYKKYKYYKQYTTELELEDID